MATTAGDDEAYVETVRDDGYVSGEAVEIEAVEPTHFIQSILESALNPWYLIFVIILAFVVYQRFKDIFDAKWSRWQQKRREAAETAELKKNPDLHRERLEKMEAARRKLQEQYDQESRVAHAKMKTREEEKRRQMVQDWEDHQQGKGSRNKSRLPETAEGVKGASVTKKKAPTFRTEFNPLMGGGGGSSGYRPARRSANAGG